MDNNKLLNFGRKSKHLDSSSTIISSRRIYGNLSISSKGVKIVETKVTLNSINFKKNSAILDEIGVKQAIELKKALKRLIRENPQGKIIILGYTSTEGSALYNKVLSVKRTKSLKFFLSRNNSILKEQF